MTASKNPKPIQVGVIICPHHDDKVVQARIKKSLVTNKLFYHCPACGLYMATLEPLQDWIKKHGKFNEDFAAMYGDGKNYDGGPEPLKEKPAAPALKEVPKPEPLKEAANDDYCADFDKEMGF